MVNVRFVVVSPDVTKAEPKGIYLAANVYDWKPDGRPLARVAAALYCATYAFPAGAKLEYKFTRDGTWDTVEKSAEGREIGNRRLIVASGVNEQVVVHQVVKWADRSALAERRVDLMTTESGGQPAQSTLTGDIRFHHDFHAPQLDNHRSIAVYLPPDYDKNADQRYPVLYMHDGQNLFDAATSFTGVEWRADETAQRLIQAGKLPPLIIVGIYNNADRRDEYTVHRDAGHDAGGQGARYVDFIVNTLKPFIDRTYRTRPGREHTAIAGSSLGGLISLYALYEHPEVFSRAGVISPALWWADEALLHDLEDKEPQRPIRLWVDIGTAEDDKATGRTYLKTCRALREILGKQGLNPETDFHYEEIHGAGHHEVNWADRLDRVLLYLFTK